MLVIELTPTSTKLVGSKDKPQANVSHESLEHSGTIVVQPLIGHAKAWTAVEKLEKGKRYRLENVGIVGKKCTTVYVSNNTKVIELA